MKTLRYLFQDITLKKILYKAAWLVWKFMGLLPYIGLTVAVNLLWVSQYSLLVPSGFIDGYRLMFTSIPNALYTLSVVGSWTLWFIICKIVKYTFIWVLTQFGAV